VDRPEQTATEVAVPWHSPTVAAGEKKKRKKKVSEDTKLPQTVKVGRSDHS